MIARKPAINSRAVKPPSASVEERAALILSSLERLGSKRVRDEMRDRYGVVTEKAFGVPVGKMQALAKREGRSHALALALWETGWYEARMVASFIDEPDRITAAQMDRWCKDFDNWGVCDTVCFHLFDRVEPELAFRKVEQWSRRRGEFQKRAGFALLACLALHNKAIEHEVFIGLLPLIEEGASDDRNFVKKGVSWALHAIATRGPGPRANAVALAQRLAASAEASRRWVGKDVLRKLGGSGARTPAAKRVSK